MKCRYTMDDLAKAIESLLEIINNPGCNYVAELNCVKENHPVVDEIDECGWKGYVGLGVGKMGGHAIGEE